MNASLQRRGNELSLNLYCLQNFLKLSFYTAFFVTKRKICAAVRKIGRFHASSKLFFPISNIYILKRFIHQILITRTQPKQCEEQLLEKQKNSFFWICLPLKLHFFIFSCVNFTTHRKLFLSLDDDVRTCNNSLSPWNLMGRGCVINSKSLPEVD